MPAQWTADVIGKMHLFGIKASELAEAIGWHPKYLSIVINSHKPPKGAKQKVCSALEKLIAAADTDDCAN